MLLYRLLRPAMEMLASAPWLVGFTYGDVRAKSKMLRLIVGSSWIASGAMLVAAPAWEGLNTAEAASALTSTVSLTV
jgi:hypothetical protein